MEHLTALGEVGQAVGSSLDLDTVLATIVSRAVQLSNGYSGIIYEYGESTQRFHARAVLAIPLVRENRLLGGLAVMRPQTGAFGDDIVELLKTFVAEPVAVLEVVGEMTCD